MRPQIRALGLRAALVFLIATVLVLVLVSSLERAATRADAGDVPVAAEPLDDGRQRLERQTATELITASVTVSSCATDVGLVFDESGSMIYYSRCYGCYDQHINYSTGEYDEYPAGARRYLPYPDWLAEAQPEVEYDGHLILTQEAEFFANNTSYGGEYDYHYDAYQRGNAYWTLQRVQNSHASGYSYESGDGRGAHMMLGPSDLDAVAGYPTMALAEANAPRLDYAFDIPTSTTWYVWARAQCGRNNAGYPDLANGCVVHWGVDESPVGSTTNAMFDAQYSDYRAGSIPSVYPWTVPWRWVRLGSASLLTGVHHINLWGGGLGFKLDKILLTTNPDNSAAGGVHDNAPSFIVNTTTTPGMSGVTNWNNVKNQPGGTYLTYIYSGQYGGPPDSGDRARISALDPALDFDMALHPCNPQYGAVYSDDWDGSGQIDPDETCDNRFDDLFDDLQPMRDAKEAYKAFVRQAKVPLDQLSLVRYSSSGQAIRELMCLLTPSAGLDRLPAGYPGLWDFSTGTPDPAWRWCYDHRSSSDGLTGVPADDVTHGSLLWGIEKMYPDASTNMAEGMKFGIDGLGTGTGHYGRLNVVKALLLFSDGVPNILPAGSDPCKADNQWPDGGFGTASDCVIFYADRAREQGIRIYTVGLIGADHALLHEVASRTHGVYYYAASGAQVQPIAEQVYGLVSGQCSATYLRKTAPAQVALGELLTTTIALSSTAPFSITGIVVRDTLPQGTVFVTATGAFALENLRAGNTLIWRFGDLANDGTPVSLTVVLSVTQPLPAYTSTASLLYAYDPYHPYPPYPPYAQFVTSVLVAPAQALPGLSVSKNVHGENIENGAVLTYTMVLSNTGRAAAYEVQLYDTLPVNTWFIAADGVFTPAHPLVMETVTWDIGTLPNSGVPVTVTLVLSTAVSTETVYLANTVTATCLQGPISSAHADLPLYPHVDEPHFEIYVPLVFRVWQP
ncbi:MAG: DUF11 domain-containing protein [Anaerolineae bacterium]|nr:DUF11 domain-containing protein [Anaerolineae bacterium]